MYEIRSFGCPGCASISGVPAQVMRHNETAGAETWARCWSCDADFQLWAATAHRGGAQHFAIGIRTPVAWNLGFSMWHPTTVIVGGT